ncbi:fatty acyl CoA synthetase [Luteimonas sp. RD2P54]|uniref:Fatty acyl CoA synthetase n=1 Tax=Luteimonas endophytica TaxID=3042023 RepID=A0ABT6JCF1_9GAMM|nr:LolA-related protein [Luteimonas endophytica]MDH5824506.1 fatty acyl CoA synthetase [Luteimonas endophytica]
MAQAAADGFDGAWILEKLARPAPARTSFVEVRTSAMLKEPLRVTGEYLRPDARTLVREVRSPYVETTTVRDGRATIERAGRSPRSFSLSRAPELAALQASFGALLAGDVAELERHYAIRTRGVRERWTMTLTPKDPELAANVRRIDLYGRGAELRCIETLPGEGALQRTLLAGAARSADPQADAAALEALCRGG